MENTMEAEKKSYPRLQSKPTRTVRHGLYEAILIHDHHTIEFFVRNNYISHFGYDCPCGKAEKPHRRHSLLDHLLNSFVDRDIRWSADVIFALAREDSIKINPDTRFWRVVDIDWYDAPDSWIPFLLDQGCDAKTLLDSRVCALHICTKYINEYKSRLLEILQPFFCSDLCRIILSYQVI